MLEIQNDAPLTKNLGNVLNSQCICERQSYRTVIPLDVLHNGTDICIKTGGKLIGESCTFKPDVFLCSVLLALGTFTVAMKLHSFKQSPFLNSFVSFFFKLLEIFLFYILLWFLDQKCCLRFWSFDFYCNFLRHRLFHWNPSTNSTSTRVTYSKEINSITVFYI